MKAKVITLHVVNQVGMSPATLARAEHAIVIQSEQVNKAWKTGTVKFGKHGYNVYIQPATHPVELGMHEDTGGYTGNPESKKPNPEAIISYQPNWSTIFSHEVIEMLVDPTGKASLSHKPKEIADPVEGSTYSIDGVTVSDWVKPSWFQGPEPASSASKADYLGTVGSGQLGPNGSQPSSD